MKFDPLPQSFYQPSAQVVAPKLLGHWLIRRTTEGFCGGPIVETEAYVVGDPASHGYKGLTERTRIMYGPPGFAYVYLIYGAHFCVNAVCRGPGHAEAVLIRAIEPLFGEKIMGANRPVAKPLLLTNGPGKLCAALAINRTQNGADLCNVAGELFIAANPGWKEFRRERGPIVVTRRIGITQAAHLDLRYYLEKSASVSCRVKRPFAPAIR